MPINRRLLKTINTREISTLEFLKKSSCLDCATGEKKQELQEKLAEEIERDYPVRAGYEQKVNMMNSQTLNLAKDLKTGEK